MHLEHGVLLHKNIIVNQVYLILKMTGVFSVQTCILRTNILTLSDTRTGVEENYIQSRRKEMGIFNGHRINTTLHGNLKGM